MMTLTEVELSEAGACGDHPVQRDVREDGGVEVDHLERSDHGVVRHASSGIPMRNYTVSITGQRVPSRELWLAPASLSTQRCESCKNCFGAIGGGLELL